MSKVIIAALVFLVKIVMEDALHKAAVYHSRQELEQLAEQKNQPERAHQASMSHGLPGFTWKPNRLGFATMVAV